MKLAALVATCLLAWVDPPPAVLELLRTSTEALANQDADTFLANFDPASPGYATLQQQVNALIAVNGASSTTEIKSDQADGQKHTLEIDWILRVGSSRRKHSVVTMTVEQRRGTWKITSFEPVDFFSAP